MNNTTESIDEATGFADSVKLTEEQRLEILMMNLHCLSSKRNEIIKQIRKVSIEI
jgi:hypothetical protein